MGGRSGSSSSSGSSSDSDDRDRRHRKDKKRKKEKHKKKKHKKEHKEKKRKRDRDDDDDRFEIQPPMTTTKNPKQRCPRDPRTGEEIPPTARAGTRGAGRRRGWRNRSRGGGRVQGFKVFGCVD